MSRRENSEKYGHATPAEMERIRALEAAPSLDNAGLAALAQLYIDPGHEFAKASETLGVLLQRSPQDCRGLFWRGYLAVEEFYYEADDGLENALRGLALVSEDEACDSGLRAGAFMLLARTRAADSSESERVELLLRSLELQPDWTNNRLALAALYARSGDAAKAATQLEAARGALKSGAFNDIGVRYFETNVTGCAMSRDSFDEAAGIIRMGSDTA